MIMVPDDKMKEKNEGWKRYIFRLEYLMRVRILLYIVLVNEMNWVFVCRSMAHSSKNNDRQLCYEISLTGY